MSPILKVFTQKYDTPKTLTPQNPYPGALSRKKERERASRSGVVVATTAVAGQTHPYNVLVEGQQ